MAIQVENNRRRLIKSLAGGSGAVAFAKLLPDQWIRPVMSTVITPAHAELTPCTSPNEVVFDSLEVEEGNSAEIQLESSESEADFEASGLPYEAVFTSTGGESIGESITVEGTLVEGLNSLGPNFGEVTSFNVTLEVDGCQIFAESGEFSVPP